MTMADVLTVTLVILGVLITLPASWLLLRALFPAAVERSRARIEAHPLTCFAVGLVPAALLFVGGVALLQAAPGGVKALGLLLLLGGFLLAGTGFAAFSLLVGGRLPGREDEGRPWRPLVRGAVCLELSFLFPVLGWFGLLPLLGVTALGAALLGLAAGASRAPAAAAPSPGPVPPA
jgi:hypothetical protein